MKPILNSNKNSSILKNIFVVVVLTVCLIIGRLLLPFNHKLLIVSSSSMEPEYPVYSLVLINKTAFEKLEEGDVIAFKSQAMSGTLALHRIKYKTDGGVYTKGDNNSFVDNQLITKEEYEGKVVFKITFMARYIASVQTLKGKILYLILPVLTIIIIAWGARTLLKNKKL